LSQERPLAEKRRKVDNNVYIT